MPVVRIETFIRAPIERCFDLARDVEIHTKTTSKTKERALGELSKGLLEVGDIVTWEAVHFGVKQRLTAKIKEMNKPHEFTDVQVKGAFHSFTHRHQFIASDNGSMMIDRFDYKAPFGILGTIADQLFLRKYMENFLTLRAIELKRIAEDFADAEKKIWE